MGASSSRARGGRRRGGLVSKDAPRHHRQRQKPPGQPQQSSASAAQDSPRRVVPYDQGPVNRNASSNSDNIQGVDRRQLSSVNDGRNPNGGTEAYQVTQAIKTLSITCDEESEPNVTCGLQAPEVQEEPKGSNSALPVIEEVDECAICLEGYDEENPKLLTQCEHHYHFHCILEWTERNCTCPICGRAAIFDETSVLQVYRLPVGSMDQ